MVHLEFKITHVDGSTDTVYGTWWEGFSEFEKVDTASLYVDRPQINGITLEEDRDEIEVFEDGERMFRGVLRDTLRGGAEVELVCDSLERFALDAEPSGGGLVYDPAADTRIVTDAIDDCPKLSAGTIEEVDGATTQVFSYASPAKRIRTVAESVGGEVRYNPDGTVDYVAQLGRDRTESATGVVLAPAEQNISGEFRPERDAGDKRVTHLKLLGAGEGSSQVEANIVPDTDPYDYEGDDTYANVRRYSADHWTGGEREAWDTRINKDITDGGTLADHGEVLISEFNAEYVDIEITVEDYEVQRGDVWTLRHPDEQVDRDLRAVKVERIADSDGVRFKTTFSNRRLTRQPEQQREQKDVDRYNMAFEGTNVTMNTSGGRQPVSANHNYQFSIYYPDEVKYEHRIKLQVAGLPYRAYSEGAEAAGSHSHRVSIPSHDHSVDVDIPSHSHPITIDLPSHDHDVDINIPSHDHKFSYSVLDHSHDLLESQYLTSGTYNGDSVEDHDHQYTSPYGVSKNVSNPDTTSTTTNGGGGVAKTVSSDGGGGVLQETTTDSGGETVTSTTTDYAGDTTQTTRSGGSHTHAPQPGIIESFNGTRHYPSNCDVIVNGTNIGEALGDGSGRFEETVDLEGHLIPGQFNRIEVSSESLGHVMAAIDVDVYRQILGRG